MLVPTHEKRMFSLIPQIKVKAKCQQINHGIQYYVESAPRFVSIYFLNQNYEVNQLWIFLKQCLN